MKKPAKAREPVLLERQALRANHLLANLPEQEAERLLPFLNIVSLSARQIIYEAGETIKQVYFPTGAIFAKLLPLNSGPSPAAGLVGRHGMVCHSTVLGLDDSPFQVIVQNPGSALHLTASAFRELLRMCPTLSSLLDRYVQTVLIQLAYSAACNGFQSLEQRCARWLLMTHDQAEPGFFQMTQEFLAQMLGANRVSVTEVAGQLQSAGLIRYQRGKVTVTNRLGLEAVACESYHHIRASYRSFLPARRAK